MSERPRILVSNDDGYQSEGIRALVTAMEELGEVFVVAPEVEQSASSHAISIHRPLRLREVRRAGTPPTGRRPTAPGSASTTCSATAARGSSCPASTTARTWPTTSPTPDAGGGDGGLDHRRAGDRVQPRRRGRLRLRPRGPLRAALVAAALARDLPPTPPERHVPPDVEPDGYVVTRLGKHSYGSDVVEKKDPRGRSYSGSAERVPARGHPGQRLQRRASEGGFGDAPQPRPDDDRMRRSSRPGRSRASPHRG